MFLGQIKFELRFQGQGTWDAGKGVCGVGRVTAVWRKCQLKRDPLRGSIRGRFRGSRTPPPPPPRFPGNPGKGAARSEGT